MEKKELKKFGPVVSAVKYLSQFINQWACDVASGRGCTDAS